MMSRFKKATKAQSRLRLGLFGPSGSGKTWTALELGSHLGSKMAVVDTERGSASKYSDKFQFDVLELTSFEPGAYVQAIADAEREGYDVIVLDSLSHAWVGKGGALDQVDKGGGRFDAWRNVTPQHNALVDAILGSKAHVLATMRVKTEYVIEKNDRGKSEPRKVGMAPVQRDGLEYEFDVTCDLDERNVLKIGKTRCSSLHGKMFQHQNRELAEALKTWLTDGSAVAAGASETSSETTSVSETASSESAPSAPSGILAKRVAGVLAGPAPTVKVKELFAKLGGDRAKACAWAGDKLGRPVTSLQQVMANEIDGLLEQVGQ